MSSNKSFSSETSNRYALALYELAKENSELEVVEKNVIEVLAIYNTSEDLKNFIDACVQECHNETKLQHKPSLKSSWFSINRRYTYHEEHNHLPDTWSGVYYIQADQDHPGLTLVNPNMKANWPRVNVSELNEANSPNVTCAAITGSLIIFPSHLHHKVEQQMVDKERIMVAFNYGF